MRNPILEEAAAVYLRRREFVLLHLGWIAGALLFTIFLWPSRGFMYFFRTETIPAVFQATSVAHVLAVSTLSLYLGMERLGEEHIIRYSEWIERTTLPVGVLFRGKLLVALVQTVFLTATLFPFALIAAGPAGAPPAAVLASTTVVLLAGLASRFAGMLVGHLGETRYALRVLGPWLYALLLFVATVQLYRPINPIVAVISQHAEDSPFMRPEASAALLDNPLVASGVPMLVLALALLVGYRASLFRHRADAIREARSRAGSAGDGGFR